MEKQAGTLQDDEGDEDEEDAKALLASEAGPEASRDFKWVALITFTVTHNASVLQRPRSDVDDALLATHWRCCGPAKQGCRDERLAWASVLTGNAAWISSLALTYAIGLAVV
jgi:hypothetical protein